MEHLIKRLTDSVAFAEQQGENMDDVSWGMQEGILISYNEAKAVIEALKAFNISSKPVLVGESELLLAFAKYAMPDNYTPLALNNIVKTFLEKRKQ